MAQKLIMAINKARITAGYKNANYRKEFGFNHYGWDLTDQSRKDKTVWGCGNGEVLEAGYDSKTGNTVIIRYNDVLLADGRHLKGIICRAWHFDKLYVKKGQKITKDTKVGLYGSTGAYASGAHYHEEWDTDLNYPNYSPSFAGNTSIIKAGTDSTVRPSAVLHVKASAPDYQSCKGEPAYDTWSKSDVVTTKY